MSYADLDEDTQVELLRPVAADGAARLGLHVADIALAHHGYNTTFRVTDDGGRSHAVRVLTNSHSAPAQLEAQHAWMHALARESAVRVPDPVVGPDGASFAVVDGGPLGETARVVAATWLPGPDIGTLGTEQAFALGVAMARLHEHATDWSLPAGTAMPTFDDPLFGDEDLLTGFPMPAADAELIATALATARPAFTRTSAAGVIPIHGDLHGGNLKWHNGELAVFDFDDSGLGTPALDLAISTFYLRDTIEGAEAAMREGYASVRPLPEVVEADLEALVASRQVLLANALLATSTASLRAEAAGYLVTTADRLRHWLATGRFTRLLPPAPTRER